MVNMSLFRKCRGDHSKCHLDLNQTKGIYYSHDWHFLWIPFQCHVVLEYGVAFIYNDFSIWCVFMQGIRKHWLHPITRKLTEMDFNIFRANELSFRLWIHSIFGSWLKRMTAYIASMSTTENAVFYLQVCHNKKMSGPKQVQKMTLQELTTV